MIDFVSEHFSCTLDYVTVENIKMKAAKNTIWTTNAFSRENICICIHKNCIVSTLSGKIKLFYRIVVCVCVCFNSIIIPILSADQGL